MADSTSITLAAPVSHDNHPTTACKILQDVQPATRSAHTLEVEDAVTTPRSKARLYAIVMALYLVMFIGALDQTIVA